MDVRLTLGEVDGELEKTALPYCLLFARHAALPVLEVEYVFTRARWFGVEAEGVVSPPLLPVDDQLVNVRAVEVVMRTSPPVADSDTETWRMFGPKRFVLEIRLRSGKVGVGKPTAWDIWMARLRGRWFQRDADS